jgi:hypothetical protein
MDIMVSTGLLVRGDSPDFLVRAVLLIWGLLGWELPELSLLEVGMTGLGPSWLGRSVVRVLTKMSSNSLLGNPCMSDLGSLKPGLSDLELSNSAVAELDL